MDNAVVVGGLGVVGTATRKLFGIDKYYDLRGKNCTIEDVSKSKYIFLTLPTKPTADGYNTEDIFNVINQINTYPNKDRYYILRSTVIPGTTDSLMYRLGIGNVIYNPEFLTMSTIDDDTFNPDIVVLGCHNPLWAKQIQSLYEKSVKNKPKYFITRPREAEMIKVSTNLFYSTKVIFANQLYDVCKKYQINYDEVQSALYERKWIGKNHLKAVFNGKRGLHGMCLRKDLEAFNRKFDMPLFWLVEEINDSLIGKKE